MPFHVSLFAHKRDIRICVFARTLVPSNSDWYRDGRLSNSGRPLDFKEDRIVISHESHQRFRELPRSIFARRSLARVSISDFNQSEDIKPSRSFSRASTNPLVTRRPPSGENPGKFLLTLAARVRLRRSLSPSPPLSGMIIKSRRKLVQVEGRNRARGRP